MAGAELHEIASSRLHVARQRYTRGRKRIVALLARAEAPTTIPEMLERDATLAQSSVYRNLVVLTDAGVVAKVVTTDDFARYELAEDLTEHHHHLVCSSCGAVADFALAAEVESELDRVLRRAARKASFDVDHHRLDLVGLCGSCR